MSGRYRNTGTRIIPDVYPTQQSYERPQDAWNHSMKDLEVAFAELQRDIGTLGEALAGVHRDVVDIKEALGYAPGGEREEELKAHFDGVAGENDQV